MTIFASTLPVNTDPFPRQSHTYPAPDPAWDQPRAHEGNPILVAVRKLREQEGGRHRNLKPFYVHAAKYLTHGTHAMGVPITVEHSDHARRVLSRLAVFA